MNSDATTKRRVVFRRFADAILIAPKHGIEKMHISACEKPGQSNKALGRKLPNLNMGKCPSNRNALR